MRNPDYFPVPAALPVILRLGPQRTAGGGLGTGADRLFESGLGGLFRLRHFPIADPEPGGTRLGKLAGRLLRPLALVRALFRQRVAIVHLDTRLDRRTCGRDLVYLLLARLVGVQIVYQVHGGELPQEFSARHRWLAPLLRTTLHLPDAIVVPSAGELAAYRQFVPGQDIRLLPQAVDSAPYARLAPRAPAGGEALELLYIGHLARDQGIYEAVHGLRLARLQGIAAHLVMAGSGPDEAGLRQAVRELNLEHDVSFVELPDDASRIKLLDRADVLILPGHGEGLPQALLEAMAAGRPVITTRVGALPDVVSDGLHGCIVPPGDIPALARAIGRLAADPARLAQMGRNCRERVAGSYSLLHLARELALLYAEIGAPRQGPAVSHF